MSEFLIPGEKYIEKYDNFRLIGFQKEFEQLCSILMRNSANSVLLSGPGGVGCTALCLGLQAAKKLPETPFDIVSKRIFWLDTDGLFSSGDNQKINESFRRCMNILYQTAESVLIIEDTNDFIEAARNNGCSHFINALALAVKLNKTQAILEVKDSDLNSVIKNHSDLRELFTLMDLKEPSNGDLKLILENAVERLEKFHQIKISRDAIETVLDLTTTYRAAGRSVLRAQPDRSITLLDRSLATYRLKAHNMPDGLSEAEKITWTARRTMINSLSNMQVETETHILELRSEIEEFKKNQQNDGSIIPDMHDPFILERTRTIKALESELVRYSSDFKQMTDEINNSLLLTKLHVIVEFSNITGISVDKLNENEIEKLKGLEDLYEARIFGQSHATKRLANAIKVARIGGRNKEKPEAAFLFLGPSGVGKTEIAKVTALGLYSDMSSLHRYDMSEYMERHSVARLIGAPPGYEGFEAGGILTNAIREFPQQITLFDEIEKGHTDIFNIMLQILSDGRLTDNIGRVVSFRHSIIMMTTNIGQTHFLDMTISWDEAQKRAFEELGDTYRPEFLNRFAGRQNIVCFNRLGIPEMEKIVRREMNDIRNSYRSRGIDVQISDGEILAFCEDQYDPKIGARGLPGFIEANLEPLLVDKFLDNDGKNIVLSVKYDPGKRGFALS